MANTDYKSIDEYLATLPEKSREMLQSIRQIIHQAVPEAKEVISYQVPCFNLNGPILYFSAYTNHVSVAAPPPTMEVFQQELADYKTSKSAFQIPIGQPIPKQLIVRMAQYRQEENNK